MASLAGTLLDLVLPPTCAGCGCEGLELCQACLRPLLRRLDEPSGTPIGMPANLPEGIAQLEWCAAYSGPVREALHALKYRGARRAARPIGRCLAARWQRAGLGGDHLVPIPVHPERLRDRGYDQATLLAEAAAAELGLPLEQSVRRSRATAAQHALGRQARATNVGHAFELEPRLAPTLRGRWPVLVDDIVTTGATLAAAALVLREAGCVGVSALVVARER